MQNKSLRDVKVSVIIPVYNNEKYIERCLKSTINQTLKEIEIIVINDASTDNTKALLEKYSDKIQVINLDSNLGPGGARNIGINAARGEYIGFVDSDDDIKKNMYEVLYNICLKTKYDMVDCAFFNEFANQNMRTIGNNSLGVLSIEKKKRLILHSGFIWSKIIKRSVITDNNIRFRENCIYEDIDFIKIVCLYCRNVGATSKILYNYRNNESSIKNSYGLSFMLESKYKSMKALVDNFKQLNMYEVYKEELKYLVYKAYTSVSCSIKSNLNDKFLELCDGDFGDTKYINSSKNK